MLTSPVNSLLGLIALPLSGLLSDYCLTPASTCHHSQPYLDLSEYCLTFLTTQHILNLFHFPLWSLTLNQLGLTPLQTSYQFICLILTLQRYARPLIQFHTHWCYSHTNVIAYFKQFVHTLNKQLHNMTLFITCSLSQCKLPISEFNSYGSSSPHSTTSSLSLGLPYSRTQSLSGNLSTPIANTTFETM